MRFHTPEPEKSEREAAEIVGRPERPFTALSGPEALQLVEKFHETDEVQIGQQTLQVNDLVPAQQTGKPIVFLSGYYAEGDSMRQVMYDMCLSGRRSLCFNAYHGIELTKSFQQRYQSKLQELQGWDPGGEEKDIMPQLTKAAALIEMLDAKGLTQVDLFAHSEGAIVATIAMHLRPDLFAKKAFLAPSGLKGDVGEFTVKALKGLDDIEVVQQRAEQQLEGYRYDMHSRVARLLPDEVSADEPAFSSPPILYRTLSPRYGEDPRQDLTNAQRTEVGRTWLEWLDRKVQYYGRLRREYDGIETHEQLTTAEKKKRKKHLDARLDRELSSLVGRRLEKWLAHMDTSDLVVGMNDRDQIYPPKEVQQYAKQGGVEQFITLRDATHNVQHYQPDKVTEFLYRALEVERPMVHKRSQSADDGKDPLLGQYSTTA